MFSFWALGSWAGWGASDARETSQLNYWGNRQLTRRYRALFIGSSQEFMRRESGGWTYFAVSALGGGQLGQHALLHVLTLLHHHLKDRERVCADRLLFAVILLLQCLEVSLESHQRIADIVFSIAFFNESIPVLSLGKRKKWAFCF